MNYDRAEAPDAAADAAKQPDTPFAEASGKWIDEFIQTSRHVLNKVAPEGKVSREDFALAYKDQSLDGHEHRAALVWSRDYDRLMNLLGREKSSGMATKTSVSQADLDRLSETMKKEQSLDSDASKINFQADSMINTYGQPGTKTLSKLDLRAALSMKAASSYAGETLIALDNHFDEIKPPGADAIGVDDIHNFYNKVQKDNPLIADEFRVKIALTVADALPAKSSKSADNASPQWLNDFSSDAQAVAEKYGHNYVLTRRDLARAISSGAADGKSEETVATLYRNFDDLSAIIKGAHSNTTATLSGEELARLPNTITEKIRNDDFWPSHAPSTIMQQFASDTADALTREDIKKALSTIDLLNYSEYRNNLQSLLDHFEEAKGTADTSRKGLTLKDIEAFADKSRLMPSARIAQYELKDTIDSLSQTKGETFSTQLFNEQLPILESIVPEAVLQGHTGDCYFEAALASVALTNPELIRDMIKDNKDGTYTVTFPGASDKPITVSRPNHLEQRLYNHASKYGCWASVLEKAYGEYRSRFDAKPPGPLSNETINNSDSDSDSDGNGNGNGKDNDTGKNNESPSVIDDLKRSSETPQDFAGHGGIVAPVMKLLTGKDTWETAIPKNLRAMEMASEKQPEEIQEELAQHLAAAFAPGHRHSPVAAVVSQFQPGGDWGHSADGFTKMHAYSITNFELTGKNIGNITVRNPHGGQGLEGTTTMPLEKFMNNFSIVYVGQY